MSRPARFIAALLLASPTAALAQSPAPNVQSALETILAATGPVVTLAVTESVEAVPDKATISTGIETRAPSGKDAMAKNAVQIDRLISALLKAGIDRKDIQTSGINLNPQYDYTSRKDGEEPRFIDYRANNTLTVVVRKIDKAGEIIDDMVGAGATNINGPTFGITDTSKLEEEARAKAVKTAQARATFYAQAAGFKGARLLAISETNETQPALPTFVVSQSSTARRAPTQVEPGQLSASITLNFRYMLER